MNIISITYKLTPLAVRNILAFDEDEKKYFFKNISDKMEEIHQCVILSTCNRLEIYFDGAPATCKKMSHFLCEYKKITYSGVAKYINTYQGDQAIRHLIKVACGVDSMVLGEDEILRQIKEAYATSHENGMTDYEFNTIFQMSMQAAKEIKTRTGISETPVSIGTLAANEVFALPLEKKRVLVLGVTGKIGSIVAKNLLSKQDVEVTGTYRSHKGPISGNENFLFLSEEKRSKFHFIPFSKRYEAMMDADVIISATSSPHLTVTREELTEKVTKKKGRLFIDLAVPNDIDEEIGGLPDCKLINIDYFDELSTENNRRKKEKAKKAEKNADEWTDEIAMELRMHELVSDIPRLEQAVQRHGVDKLIYSLRKYSDRNGVDEVADWIEAFLDMEG